MQQRTHEGPYIKRQSNLLNAFPPNLDPSFINRPYSNVLNNSSRPTLLIRTYIRDPILKTNEKRKVEMHFYPLLFFKGQILEQKSPIRSYTIKKYTIQSKFELLYLGSTIDRIESMRNDSFSPFPVDRRWANVGTKRRRASGAIIRLVRAAAKLRVNEPRRTR